MILLHSIVNVLFWLGLRTVEGYTRNAKYVLVFMLREFSRNKRSDTGGFEPPALGSTAALHTHNAL